MKLTKKVISTLLLLALVLAAVPLMALEASADEPTPDTVQKTGDMTLYATEATSSIVVTGGTEGTDYTYESGTLTVLTSTELTLSSSGATTDKIVVQSGTGKLILNGLQITGADPSLNAAGTCYITLAEGTTNTLQGGITVEDVFLYGPGTLNCGDIHAYWEVYITDAAVINAASISCCPYLDWGIVSVNIAGGSKVTCTGGITVAFDYSEMHYNDRSSFEVSVRGASEVICGGSILCDSPGANAFLEGGIDISGNSKVSCANAYGSPVYLGANKVTGTLTVSGDLAKNTNNDVIDDLRVIYGTLTVGGTIYGSFYETTGYSRSLVMAGNIVGEDYENVGGVYFADGVGTVYAHSDLPADLTVQSGESLMITGVGSSNLLYGNWLTVGSGLTVTNNGCLMIQCGENLDIAGTLTGSGSFAVIPTITIPELTYDGTNQVDKITVTGADITAGGQTFVYDPSDWTIQMPKTVKAAGSYTVTATHTNGRSISQSFSVNKLVPTIAINETYSPGKTYDGAAISNPTEEELAITGAEYADAVFTWTDYYGNPVEGTPVNGGCYTLTATIPGNSNREEASAVLENVVIGPAKVFDTPQTLSYEIVSVHSRDYTLALPELPEALAAAGVRYDNAIAELYAGDTQVERSDFYQYIDEFQLSGESFSFCTGSQLTLDGVYTLTVQVGDSNFTNYADTVEVILTASSRADGRQTVLDVSQGNIAIEADSLDAYGSDGTHITVHDPDGYVITGYSSEDAKKVKIHGDHKITLQELTVDLSQVKYAAAFAVEGNVEITLLGENILRGGTERAGLAVGADACLTITAQSTGSLIASSASSGFAAAAIGGNYNGNIGPILIQGGSISAASGGSEVPAIGAGRNGTASTIRITGGSFAAGDVEARTVYGIAIDTRSKISLQEGDYPYLVVPSDPLKIITQPTTQKVLAGTKAVFTVEAAGEDVTYQWQYKTSSSGSWKNCTAEGNTTAAMSVDATTSKSSYYYRCCVTDVFGDSLYTNTVRLYVLGIKTQPATQTVKTGTTATFTVSATGSNKSYQWQYKTSSNGKWLNCTADGNTTATLKVAATTGKSSYYYRCKITDSADNMVYTNTVRLYVLGVKTQPVTQKVVTGTTATFTVSATGLNKSYQWQYKTSSEGNWLNCTADGNTTATLKVAATTGKSSYYYRCVIKDSAGNQITTKTVRLYVLGITTQPKTQTVKTGTTAQFTVSATGSNKTYQWQYKTSADGTWKNCTADGSKTAALNVTATGKNGYYYRCRIRDSAGNEICTNEVRLYVLSIKTQPVSATAAKGTTVKFTVTAIGNGLTYQWQYRTGSDGEWKNATASGNKTAELTLTATAARSGNQYRCIVTDSAGNVLESSIVTLKLQ